jgi:hypothetical protein
MRAYSLAESAKPRPAWRLAGATILTAIMAITITSCSSAAKAGTKVSFPPKNPAAFRAFADTGNASKVQPVGTSSVGQRSCPDTTIYATVSPSLSGRPLEADLSAFFVHSGLISTMCPASVYAYYSKSEYQADSDGGFTAGSVTLTVSGTQSNLAVDTGNVTSGAYDIKSQFSFNF